MRFVSATRYFLFLLIAAWLTLCNKSEISATYPQNCPSRGQLPDPSNASLLEASYASGPHSYPANHNTAILNLSQTSNHYHLTIISSVNAPMVPEDRKSLNQPLPASSLPGKLTFTTGKLNLTPRKLNFTTGKLKFTPRKLNLIVLLLSKLSDIFSCTSLSAQDVNDFVRSRVLKSLGSHACTINQQKFR
ncbi:hypothetical protein K435DRAFT_845562, partial [Dendrothele bispora CBS 962.96]